jgi:hypothetical protein
VEAGRSTVQHSDSKQKQTKIGLGT